MKQVGAFEAKTHLPKLLDLVAKGESVAITRRGKLVAMLVPATPAVELSPSEAVARLRALRVGLTWGQGTSIREAIAEGRQ